MWVCVACSASHPAMADKDVATDRVIAPTRRPDGSLRKEIRIRAGYTPQDEVAIYQPKGAQLRKGLDVPPGYDPTSVAKPKTKAAKKNEKRKEKKQQTVNAPSSQESPASDGVSNISDHLSTLKVSTTGEGQQLNPSEQADSANVTLDKRIRALKKKIRLMELKETSSPGTSLSSEQTEKLEAWRLELQGLEASLASE